MIKTQLKNDIGNNYICYDPLDSSQKDYFKVTILNDNTFSYGEYRKTVKITNDFDECVNAIADWYVNRYLEVIDSSAYYDEVEKHIKLWRYNEKE